MKKSVHGIPFTGTNTAMKPTPAVKTSPSTSRDAEKLIKQPPQPFQNKNNIKNLPISGEPYESYDTDYTGPNRALIGKKVGAKALPNQADVGQKKPINHAGNVFGRFGTKHPKKHGPQNLDASRRSASFYGE